MCNDASLLGILSVVKRMVLLIQIIVPILLIIFGAYSFIKLLQNPDEKNGIKKIINQFLAAGIVFFLPLLVNVVMGILGEKTNLSSCWNSASDEVTVSTKYEETEKEERKKFTYNARDYENGIAGELDFSCTSNIVRAEFSCETLSIVEKHLYDFNAQNFYTVINNQYGGFENYAKSLGGIFSTYYGKTIEGRREIDFQIAAEYVFGWMYMYGWDRAFLDHEINWGAGTYGGKYAPDAFYVNGGFSREDISRWRGVNSWSEALKTVEKPYDFDKIISGEYGVGGYGCLCGDIENFIFSKMGINLSNMKLHDMRLKDVKVGDVLGLWNKATDRSHVTVIGEVYSDHIVIYDMGGFPSSRKYKTIVKLPQTSSKQNDIKALQQVYESDLAGDYGIRRHYNFEAS